MVDIAKIVAGIEQGKLTKDQLLTQHHNVVEHSGTSEADKEIIIRAIEKQLRARFPAAATKTFGKDPIVGRAPVPESYDSEFSPEPHISRGYIDLNSNAVFRYIADALRCFGYTGGHYQQGAWPIKGDKDRAVWFPKLDQNNRWINRLSSDKKTITEVQANTDGSEDNGNYREWASRIVFAWSKDDSGEELYRFVGEFSPDPDSSSDREKVFRRLSDRVDIIKAK